jgi:hypothetical protein
MIKITVPVRCTGMRSIYTQEYRTGYPVSIFTQVFKYAFPTVRAESEK